MSKHTPGPWATTVGDRNPIAVVNRVGQHLATVDRSCPQARENAQLIAAAPDMYRVIADLLDTEVRELTADVAGELLARMSRIRSRVEHGA